MTNNARQSEISDMAKEIINIIRYGKLYGKNIDMDNMEEVIVAAYLIGESKISFGSARRTQACSCREHR